MSGDPYNKAVRALFAQPAHAGGADGGTRVLVEDQGVCIELSAAARGGVIERMRFRAWGCPHLIAAAEWLCEHYEGKGLEALEDFPFGPIMENLAIPTEKTGRILVLEDAVRSLGQKFGDGS